MKGDPAILKISPVVERHSRCRLGTESAFDRTVHLLGLHGETWPGRGTRACACEFPGVRAQSRLPVGVCPQDFSVAGQGGGPRCLPQGLSWRLRRRWNLVDTMDLGSFEGIGCLIWPLGCRGRSWGPGSWCA